MISDYKVLGQASPLATSETLLYTAPPGKMTVISSIAVSNRSASASTFRVSISAAGAATANKDYVYYDVSVPANDTFVATVGLTLDATDVVRVYSSSANLSFSLWGCEVSNTLGATGPVGATGPAGVAGTAGVGGARQNDNIDANTRVWLPMNSTFGATGAINYGSLGGTWGASNTLFGAIGVFTCAAVATSGAGQLQSPSSYYEPSGAFTVMSWVYLESYGNTTVSRLLVKKAYPGTAWVGISPAASIMMIGFLGAAAPPNGIAYSYFVFCPSGTTGSTFTQIYSNPVLYPLKTWMHIASTFDGEYYRIFRNGVEMARSPKIAGRMNEFGRGPWVLGPIPGATANDVPIGQICDVRMDDVAKTEQELFEIYKKGVGLA